MKTIISDKKIYRLHGEKYLRQLKQNLEDVNVVILNDSNQIPKNTSKIISIGGEEIYKKAKSIAKNIKHLHIATTLYSAFFHKNNYKIKYLKTLPEKQISNALSYIIEKLTNEEIKKALIKDEETLKKIIKKFERPKKNPKFEYLKQEILKKHPNLLHGYAHALAQVYYNKSLYKSGKISLEKHKKIKKLLQNAKLPIVMVNPPSLDK